MIIKIKSYLQRLIDKKSIIECVPSPQIVKYENWRNYLVEKMNVDGFDILEIGSREITQTSTLRHDFDKANYVGFDYKDGNNVDVVGDAHKLTSYFKKNKKFDLIFSSATFEHFDRPWLVAEEIANLLTIGGFLFVETHFSYRTHERPWHFFLFSDMALRSLFSRKLGFEVIDCGMYNPIVGRFSALADVSLHGKRIAGMYCHSSFFGKKIEHINDFNWRDISTSDIVNSVDYPQ